MFFDFGKDRAHIDRPAAWNHVRVLSAGGDVFDVIVTRMRGHALDPKLWISAHAVCVPNVES